MSICERVVCRKPAVEMVHGDGFCPPHAHEERQHVHSEQNSNSRHYDLSLRSTDAEILWSADDRPIGVIFAGIRYILVEDSVVA